MCSWKLFFSFLFQNIKLWVFKRTISIKQLFRSYITHPDKKIIMIIFFSNILFSLIPATRYTFLQDQELDFAYIWTRCKLHQDQALSWESDFAYIWSRKTPQDVNSYKIRHYSGVRFCIHRSRKALQDVNSCKIRHYPGVRLCVYRSITSPHGINCCKFRHNSGSDLKCPQLI